MTITLGKVESGVDGPIASQDRRMWLGYKLALVAAISAWLIPVRSALRVDETGSYWQICAGLAEIWPRRFLSLSFPAYSYILWFSTKLIGTSEVALRIPSILAMLGAVYLLYLAGRELVDREFAMIAAILFTVEPTVHFEAIDARPYGFAMLITNAAILALLRLRRDDSNLPAAVFGLLATGMLYFQFLFAALFPAFLICLIAMKSRNRGVLTRQLFIAVCTGAAALLPLIPVLRYLARTAGMHVYEPVPTWDVFLFALFTPVWLVPVFVLTAMAEGLKSQDGKRGPGPGGLRIVICASLGLIPSVVLYVVSVTTSVHVFGTSHYRMSGTPGMALCWAMIFCGFRSRAIRLFGCTLYVAVTIFFYATIPTFTHHHYSWKSALQVVQQMTSKDNAPVVVCSDFVESAHVPMPDTSPKSSWLFAPLSYYRISAPVVPLPEVLNSESSRVFLPFLEEAKRKHERFLAIGEMISTNELDWLKQNAAGAYTVRDVGIYDQVKVFEFVPRDLANQNR